MQALEVGFWGLCLGALNKVLWFMQALGPGFWDLRWILNTGYLGTLGGTPNRDP